LREFARRWRSRREARAPKADLRLLPCASFRARTGTRPFGGFDEKAKGVVDRFGAAKEFEDGWFHEDLVLVTALQAGVAMRLRIRHLRPLLCCPNSQVLGFACAPAQLGS
jgi:hypothetical protein